MDLEMRWGRFSRAMGVQDEGLFVLLKDHYSEPHRAYHALDHIGNCLEELDSLGHVSFSECIEAAIWFHDVIYDPLAKDNEERSAAFAAQQMHGWHLHESFVQRVQNLIMSTKHTHPPATIDSQIMVDIDLAILGKPAPVFDRYEEGIRKEYVGSGLVHAADYRKGRQAVIESFLHRESLYHTPLFSGRYEAQAKENLQRSLTRLREGI